MLSSYALSASLEDSLGNVASDTLVMRAIGSIGGSQSWSVGLKATVQLVSESWSVQNLTSVSNALEPFWNTWWTAVNPYCRSAIGYGGIKCYYIPQGFHTATLQASTTRAVSVGTGSVNGSPDYTAMVVTLGTAFVGRTARGRIYVPTTATMAATDGQFLQAQMDVVRTATKTLITSLNGYTNTPSLLSAMTVCVSSTASKLKAATNSNVTSLKVDSRPDMQERRINKQGALRVSVASIP